MTCRAEVIELASGHGPTQEGKIKAAPPCSLRSGGWQAFWELGPVLGEGRSQVALAAGAWENQT